MSGGVVYEVTLEVGEELRPALERYMTERHLPQIDATGCFRSIRFERSDEGLYRASFEAAARSDLDRYLREHTRAMRDDFLRHFPEGVEIIRTVWKQIADW